MEDMPTDRFGFYRPNKDDLYYQAVVRTFSLQPSRNFRSERGSDKKTREQVEKNVGHVELVH